MLRLKRVWTMETMIEYVRNKLLGRNYEVAIDFTMGNKTVTNNLVKFIELYKLDYKQKALHIT